MRKVKIGVVGAGFVGGSVINGFDTDTVELLVVDPKLNTNTISMLVAQEAPIVFICVPTPSLADGSVDPSYIESVLTELDHSSYKGIVVIKSTITPNHLTRFATQFNVRIVYNPEFLTEANAHQDFINPAMQILGGKWYECEYIEKVYVQHSKVKIVPTFKTDIITASLLKYTINSWLATKVTWMNELYKVHQASGADSTWEQFTDMLSRDERVGKSHLKVPGPDGLFGFGGHCFPKDTAAFLSYVNEMGGEMLLLDRANRLNKRQRPQK